MPKPPKLDQIDIHILSELRRLGSIKFLLIKQGDTADLSVGELVDGKHAGCTQN